MLDILNRIRKFDPRELTPAQIALGVVALIVVLAVLNFILSLANTLLPIALIGGAVYFGYRWMNSRSEALPEQKSKSQKVVEEAANNRQKAQQKAEPERVVMTVEDDTRADAAAQEATEAKKPLMVEQQINPETGFKEPNIERLVEKEQEKMAEMDRVNDDVMAQIEARRKRLLGKDDT